MKITVVIEERGCRPFCRGLFDTRKEAEEGLLEFYRKDLKFEGLSDEEISEAVEEAEGKDYLFNEDYLSTTYTVANIYE